MNRRPEISISSFFQMEDNNVGYCLTGIRLQSIINNYLPINLHSWYSSWYFSYFIFVNQFCCNKEKVVSNKTCFCRIFLWNPLNAEDAMHNKKSHRVNNKPIYKHVASERSKLLWMNQNNFIISTKNWFYWKAVAFGLY